MVDQLDYQELNSLVKHFLEYNGLKDSVQTFDQEIRSKVLQNQAKITEEKARAKRSGSSARQKGDEELLSILKVNKVP